MGAHPAAASVTDRQPRDVLWYELRITHELRVPADDPDVAALRAGAAAYDPTRSAETRIGRVDTEYLRFAPVFSPPVLRVAPGSRQAVITYSGIGYSTYGPGNGEYLGLQFDPPSNLDLAPGEAGAPLSAHEIIVSATGWTVAGVRGPPPVSQDRHQVRWTGGQSSGVALVRNGRTASVASFLTGSPDIGTLMDGSDRPTDPPGETSETDPDFVPRGLEALQQVLAAAALLVAIHAFLPASSAEKFMGLMLLLTWAGILWLLPGAAAESEHVRSPVTQDEHRLLVRDMIRRRSARLALTDLLRSRPGPDQTFEEYEARRTALEHAGDERAGPVDSDLALATLAGQTPWRNGLAALGIGALLSVPFSTVRIVASADVWRTGGTDLIVASMALLSLPALCMVFGYFYPRVRGGNPVAKSLALLVAALLIELPGYVQAFLAAAASSSNLTSSPSARDEALVGMLVAVGNIAAVSIGLGLWWEWRLMWLAGEPWARIRSIRSMRALAAPLAAIAIAIATTVATALVNNVIAPLPTVQEPQRDSSSSTLPTARP